MGTWSTRSLLTALAKLPRGSWARRAYFFGVGTHGLRTGTQVEHLPTCAGREHCEGQQSQNGAYGTYLVSSVFNLATHTALDARLGICDVL